MSLADDLKGKLTAARRAPGLRAWLDTLDAETMAVLVELAPDTTISHAKFTAILGEFGCQAHKDSITTWRKQHGFPVV